VAGHNFGILRFVLLWGALALCHMVNAVKFVPRDRLSFYLSIPIYHHRQTLSELYTICIFAPMAAVTVSLKQLKNGG